MKWIQYLTLLAPLLFGGGKEELIIPPSNENRQTSVIVEGPKNPPPLNTSVQYRIIIRSKNFPPKSELFSEMGQISDSLLALAVPKEAQIEKEGTRVLEYDRGTKDFVPVKESSEIKRKITKIAGELLIDGLIDAVEGILEGTPIETPELKLDLETIVKKTERAKSLFDERFKDHREYKLVVIPKDTHVAQDPYNDELQFVIQLRFQQKPSQIPAVLMYDAREAGFGKTASSVTLEVIVNDIVNPRPQEISVDTGNNKHIDMIYIPPGEVTMVHLGDDTEEEALKARIKIPKGIYISKYETTQEQFEALMGYNPSEVKGANLPVTNITWEEAFEFCNRLSQREGKKFRLQSEPEWEYVRRMVSATTNGEDLDKLGWYKGNSNKIQPVGQKEPISGVYDLVGNARELCSTIFRGEIDYTKGFIEESDRPDLWGPIRVVRGGDYTSEAYMCKPNFRDTQHIKKGDKRTGFRVVLDP